MKVERWTLSSQDALIGVELTATLTDSDGGVPDSRRLDRCHLDVGNRQRHNRRPLRIQRKATQKVIPGATSDTYTPKAGDRGMYLRAIAMYTDRTRDAADRLKPTCCS